MDSSQKLKNMLENERISMKSVYKVIDNEEKEVLSLLPEEFIVDYIYNQAQNLYVLKIEKEICGAALISSEGDDAIIDYMYVNEDNRDEYIFLINSISYEVYKDGARRIVWKFLQEDDEVISILQKLDFVINEDNVDIILGGVKLSSIDKSYLSKLTRLLLAGIIAGSDRAGTRLFAAYLVFDGCRYGSSRKVGCRGEEYLR
jgi:hypothetical protein